MRNRNSIEVKITIDELVYDKVIKYIKKKNLPSFDDFTNRALENKMKFVETQKENYYKTEDRKKEYEKEIKKENEERQIKKEKEKERERKNKSPVFLGIKIN